MRLGAICLLVVAAGAGCASNPVAPEPSPSIAAVDPQALLESSRPVIDKFLDAVESKDASVVREVVTGEYTLVRFPGGDERITFSELSRLVDGCSRNANYQSNTVAVSISYACANGQTPRVVFNFKGGRINRVLAGVLEPIRAVPRPAAASPAPQLVSVEFTLNRFVEAVRKGRDVRREGLIPDATDAQLQQLKRVRDCGASIGNGSTGTRILVAWTCFGDRGVSGIVSTLTFGPEGAVTSLEIESLAGSPRHD